MLVTGAAGLVGGRAARAALTRGHEVHGTFHRARGEELPCVWHGLDRGDAAQCLEVIRAARPHVILDCASWTDVDGCEADPQRAERDNARGARNLCEAAAREGARVLHVGTDFVFGGEATRPYAEGDPPDPRGVYARTKRAAEHAVLAHPDNAVLRSGVVFGWHPRKLSFSTWLVRELRAGKQVRVVTDQWGTPTLADSLAEGLVLAAEKGARGLWHMAGGECVSREGFARALAEVFGLDARLVVPVTTAELRQRAPRPAYACLDSSRAARELGYRPLPLREAIARVREDEPA